MNRSEPKPASGWPEQRPQPAPLPANTWDEDPRAPDWQMAPLPPEEPPVQKRRIWIWLLVVALLGCLAICVLSFGWLEYTDSGRDFQTRVAEEELNRSGD
ncbi:MAG: hypothetical protein M9947_12160 [Thermomicrobiales bacterium]|nr:hypothetical protein [Thermomicrobiales bacterium]